MPLTDAEILALKPKSKPYKFSIGKGAYILVMPNGHKYWRLNYHLDAKEGTCALGVFPEVPADAAIAARDSARALVREGINPSAARREAREKSVLSRAVFRLALSKCGALTIETDKNALTLTLPQTQILAAFLRENSHHDEECE
jgi:hypothetical protein